MHAYIIRPIKELHTMVQSNLIIYDASKDVQFDALLTLVGASLSFIYISFKLLP